ncbi:DUF1638 domain-containing protein [Desulfosarcina sp.]|uniref:DUF1638 domain-containing protein n=1 Tax=Desulfosarcina sp. TaxID=2027861 RepID=UPI003565687E
MSMMKKRIIACQVFADELLAVLSEVHQDIDVTWLDAGLHWNLDKLEATLKQVLADAAAEGEDVRFLFGHGCHPDMCQIVNNHGGKILAAKNCVEAFCGDRIDELEQNRTMVITPGWIRASSNMMAAAGYDEVDIRQNFGFYDRFLLMDTGVNPLSEEEILEFYDLVQVPVEIQEISLDHFRAKLAEMLR